MKTLSVSPGRVTIRRGNTGEVLLDRGTGGSRVTHVLGRASQAAADALRAKLQQRSGKTLRDDRFVDASGASEAFEAVAARICANGPIEVVGTYDGTHDDPHHEGDYTFTGYSIEVEVDRDTGVLRVTDALMVCDVGEVINPVAHQCQIDGGFIAGLGNPGEGPYGAKMDGELSNTGVAPAVANAIHDAVGVRMTEFPITAERLHAGT